MQVQRHPVNFPVSDGPAVSEIVDRIEAAARPGEEVVVLLESDGTAHRADDLALLRLSYIHRVEDLLLNRPPRARIVSEIHRRFDALTCDGLPGDPRTVRFSRRIFADILAACVRARGHDVLVDPEAGACEGERTSPAVIIRSLSDPA